MLVSNRSTMKAALRAGVLRTKSMITQPSSTRVVGIAANENRSAAGQMWNRTSQGVSASAFPALS